jgi:RNA polymerase sigma-70 factor (ECF subfamily)
MSDRPADSAETARLLDRVAAGDPAAAGLLLDRHRGPVREFLDHRVCPRLRARVDPSDHVQEAQLDARRRLPDFLARRPMPFRVWLLRTAYEHLLMARRRHLGADRRAAGREEPLPEASAGGLADRLAGRASSPSRQLERAERVEQVRRALARLSDDGEVLLMPTYEDLSYEAIAAVLDVTPSAARQRLARALRRLSRLLTDAGFGENDHD